MSGHPDPALPPRADHGAGGGDARDGGGDDKTLRRILFAPRSVALIGASDDLQKTTARPLAALKRHGFRGPIYPVHPHRAQVQGLPAYEAISVVPGPVDHAYVLLDSDAAVTAVEACASANAKAVSLLAGGFAEAGEAGRERQRRILQAARASGMRILGPNCLGIVNTHNGLCLSANAAFTHEALQPGRVALLSQSGSMIGSVLSRGAERGLAFSKLVSVGNEADLNVGDLGLALIDDPETHAFLLFLETIRDAATLAAFASRAHAAGKPVIALKLGRSQEARDLALTHTGAMVGDDVIADAFFRDVGIARVCSIEGLVEAVPLFANRLGPHSDHADGFAAPGCGASTASTAASAATAHAPLARPGIGVITTTGGGGALIIDALASEGLAITAIDDAMAQALSDDKVTVHPGPMADMTLAGARYTTMRRAIETMAASGLFAVVVAAIGTSARHHPELAVQPLIDANVEGGQRAASGETIVAAHCIPAAPDALARLAAAGRPSFRTAESCADVLRAFMRWQAPRRGVSPYTPPPPSGRAVAMAGRAAVERLRALGIACAPAYSVDLTSLDGPQEGPGATPGQSRFALPFAYPVVVKMDDADITHKTELGGVITGITDGAALDAALATLRKRAAAAGIALRTALVQPQVSAVQEVLVGYRRDPLVGPVITLAPGGVLAELMGDMAVALAPVTRAEAHAMIASLRTLEPLRGYRGGPRGAIDALAETIVALSALAGDPQTLEAEINPVMVLAERTSDAAHAHVGAIAVDALLVVDDGRVAQGLGTETGAGRPTGHGRAGHNEEGTS